MASGCTEENDQLINDDVEAIKMSNKVDLEICQWKFLPPIAPHIAAEQSGGKFSAQSIADFCNSPQFNAFDHVLIEGAGGLMAPLNATETWVNFIQKADLQVILVVGMRLGCLNHALLTEAVLMQQGIRCLGWIANCIDPEMQVLEENIETLKARMTIPYLGTIPYRGQIKFTVTF